MLSRAWSWVRGLSDLVTLIQFAGSLGVAGFLAIVGQGALNAALGLSPVLRFLLGVCIFFMVLAIAFAILKAVLERQPSVKTESATSSTSPNVPQEIPSSSTTHTIPQHPPRPPREITDESASASYIKDRALYIFDLARRSTIIKDKTFEDCDIHGPAVAAILSGTDFIDCTFAEGGNHSSLIWTPEPSRNSYVGAIGLEECIFRRCNFRNVGLLTRIDYGGQQGATTEL